MFRLSAFADEYDPCFAKQLEGVRKNGIEMIEPRGLDGKSIADLSLEEAERYHRMLVDAGIGISAIGSPIGKIAIEAPMEPELERLRRVAEIAHIMGTDRIRVFSFFMKPEECAKNRAEVMRRMTAMVKVAEQEQVLLCHENEKDIYGDTAERCMDLWREMGGAIALVYDAANFLDIGQEAYPHAYEVMKEAILYCHIKDSLGGCQYRPAGKGAGRIGEMLAAIARDQAGKELVLTLEPHLKIFGGMASLEQDMDRIHTGEGYPDNHTAFDAAVEALRSVLPKEA